MLGKLKDSRSSNSTCAVLSIAFRLGLAGGLGLGLRAEGLGLRGVRVYGCASQM